MSDLIDRQAAIDAVLGVIPYDEYWKEQIEKAVNALPSAQPTEASCWGCNCPKMERLKEQKTFSEMVHLHDAETHEMNADDFCSRAERREK